MSLSNVNQNDDNGGRVHHDNEEDDNGENPHHTELEPERRAGVLLTALNSVVTMVGIGVCAMSFGFAKADSLIMPLVFIVVCAVLSTASAYMLAWCCDATKRYTFRGLVMAAFPALPKWTLDVVVVVSNTAALMVYARVLGDSFPKLLHRWYADADSSSSSSSFLAHSWFYIVVSAAVFLPLSAIPRLRESWPLALLGVTASVAVAAFVISQLLEDCFGASASTATCPKVVWHHVSSSAAGENATTTPHASNNSTTDDDDMQRLFFSFDSGWLQAFSIISGSFLYQMNVPQQYFELADRSPRRLALSSAVANAFAVVIYAGMGASGYLRWAPQLLDRAETGGNVLNAFAADSALGTAARIVLDVHIACAFPVYLIVTRRCLGHVLHRCCCGLRASDFEQSLSHRFVLGGCLVVVILTAAAVLPGIGDVCEITGAVFGVSLGVTIPALLYATLQSANEKTEEATASQQGWSALQQLLEARGDGDDAMSSCCWHRRLWPRVLAWMLVAFGVAETALSLAFTIRGWIG